MGGGSVKSRAATLSSIPIRPLFLLFTKNTPTPRSSPVAKDVGLPDGQMGNSEVGHLNLGAGRIVYQELQRINVAIRSGEFQQNPVLLNAIRFARENKQNPAFCLGW